MNLYIIAIMIIIAIFLSLSVPSSKITTNNGIGIEYIQKDMSIQDYITAPIDSLVGNSDGQTIKASNTGSPSGAIGLVLLVLAIGGFVSVCTLVGIYEQLINTIINSNLGIYKITSLLATYFVLSGATYGLYETAICYIPILISLYKRYNVQGVFAIKLLILGVSVGYIASPINPFATMIADQITGNTANLFALRSGILVVLTIVLNIYLLLGLRNHQVCRLELCTNNQNIKFTNIVLLLLPYVYMTIGFIPNLWFEASMSTVTMMFVIVGFTIGLVNKLSITEVIDNLILGINGYIILGIAIVLARTVYIILYNSQVIDTIIYSIVRLISPLSNSLILIGVTLLFLGLSYIITSPSALGMITLPIIAPALELVGISISSTVTLFLVTHGLSKMYSLVSPVVITSLDQTNTSYKTYLKEIRGYVYITMIIGFSIVFVIA